MQLGEGKMAKEKLSEDILKSADELLEKEWKEGREAYYIAKRLARLAGFTGKEEHFQKAIVLLRQVNESKGWRDEIISSMAISYARTGDHATAWEWSNKLYFGDIKDKTRLAIIDLLLENGRMEIAEKLLENFEGPYLYLKGLLKVGASTGRIKHFQKAYDFALSTASPAFDRIEALLDIEEALKKAMIRNKNT